MNHYDHINSKKYIFLTNICEPEENVLEFQLTMGAVGPLEDSKKSLGVDVGPSRPIYHDQNSEVFTVRFSNYIAYTVLNESYESLGGAQYTGKTIRIYTQSNFLEYIKADTFATANYPGAFTHYAFISLKHIINVVATKAPTITKTH